MHNISFHRRFAHRALLDKFNAVRSDHHTDDGIHLRHNGDSWVTMCKPKHETLIMDGEVKVIDWGDVSLNEICSDCLREAWLKLFDFKSATYTKAFGQAHYLYAMDNMLHHALHSEPYVHDVMAVAIISSFNRNLLRAWLPYMLTAQEIDTVFGKRFSVGPGNKPLVINLHKKEASLTYSEALALKASYCESADNA